jgi:hypothetical protein
MANSNRQRMCRLRAYGSAQRPAEDRSSLTAFTVGYAVARVNGNVSVVHIVRPPYVDLQGGCGHCLRVRFRCASEASASRPTSCTSALALQAWIKPLRRLAARPVLRR